ncbi:hypothetical protein Bca101_097775 [Brassica carinata]
MHFAKLCFEKLCGKDSLEAKEMAKSSPRNKQWKEWNWWLSISAMKGWMMCNLLLKKFDVLSWWNVHKLKYPVLAEVAIDLMAKQVSSVASESAFSTSGKILEPYGSCLTHYIIEVLMCSEQWLHADFKLKETIITKEQILADVEKLDKLKKGMNSFAFLLYSFALYIGHLTEFPFAFLSEFEAHNFDD